MYTSSQSKTMGRMIYAFGILMALLMVSSLIAPIFTRNSSSSSNTDATAITPTATLPPSIANPEAITIVNDTLHPSGIFAVGVPDGWAVSNNVNDTSRAHITLNNADNGSSITTGLEKPATALATVQDLSDYFNEARLQQAWATNYPTWTELGRPSTDTELIINFRLHDRNSVNYMGRLVASATDNGLIHFTRVVVPDNDNQDAMVILADLEQGSLQVLEPYADGPFGWVGYYDQINQWMLRFSRTWSKAGGATGQATTFFNSANNATVLIEVLQSTSIDESSAQSYVEDRFPTAQRISTALIERTGGDGFSVTFSTEDFDGEPVSGAVQFVNGSTGALYILTALVPGAQVDLNDADASILHIDLLQALESFSLITNVNLPELPATATPTPFPTLVPTVTPEGMAEATPEATPEATEEATDEATDEAG